MAVYLFIYSFIVFTPKEWNSDITKWPVPSKGEGIPARWKQKAWQRKAGWLGAEERKISRLRWNYLLLCAWNKIGLNIPCDTDINRSFCSVREGKKPLLASARIPVVHALRHNVRCVVLCYAKGCFSSGNLQINFPKPVLDSVILDEANFGLIRLFLCRWLLCRTLEIFPEINGGKVEIQVIRHNWPENNKIIIVAYKHFAWQCTAHATLSPRIRMHGIKSDGCEQRFPLVSHRAEINESLSVRVVYLQLAWSLRGTHWTTRFWMKPILV